MKKYMDAKASVSHGPLFALFLGVTGFCKDASHGKGCSLKKLLLWMEIIGDFVSLM